MAAGSYAEVTQAGPGRLSRFQRKHPEHAGCIPKKELAAYLYLTRKPSRG
jgi:hypothetical protein